MTNVRPGSESSRRSCGGVKTNCWKKCHLPTIHEDPFYVRWIILTATREHCTFLIRDIRVRFHDERKLRHWRAQASQSAGREAKRS